MREAAVKAIESLGPEALPALRKIKNSTDPDVRVRIAKWIPEFETRALVAPKTITLHLKKQSPRQALEAVAKQAGYKLVFNQSAAQASEARDVDFEKAPFWVAVDKICSGNGLTANLDVANGGLALYCENGTLPFACHHGAFRIVVDRLSHEVKRELNLNRLNGRDVVLGRSGDESFGVDLTICAEPHVQILEADFGQITEVRDNRKNSLILPNADSSGFALRRTNLGGVDAITWTLGLPLKLKAPSSDAVSISTLKGTIKVTLAKERKIVTISDRILTAKDVTCRAHNGTVKIVEVTKMPEGYVVDYVFTSEAPEVPNLMLTDVKGNGYWGESGGSINDGQQVKGKMRFLSRAPHGEGTPPGEPAKLFLCWWETLEYQVPFEFHDLPLP